MHKVKTQRSGELFVKNMLILKFFCMLKLKIIKWKNYLTHFRKFSEGNFRTHNLTVNHWSVCRCRKCAIVPTMTLTFLSQNVISSSFPQLHLSGKLGKNSHKFAR